MKENPLVLIVLHCTRYTLHTGLLLEIFSEKLVTNELHLLDPGKDDNDFVTKYVKSEYGGNGFRRSSVACLPR